MCLHSLAPMVFNTVTEPMTVYKIVAQIGDELRAPFYPDYRYSIGQMAESILGRPRILAHFDTLEVGLHSLASKERAFELINELGEDCTVLECQIPVGAVVVRGYWRENRTIGYTSDKLLPIREVER